MSPSPSPRLPARLPSPADFAPPPKAADLARWAEADRAARPARLARLRARFEAAGIDAYFGLRREHMRYLTGFTLGDGEEKVAGTSGLFLIGREDVIVLADSRYTIQAAEQSPDARMEQERRKRGSADYRNAEGVLRDTLVKLVPCTAYPAQFEL